MVPFHSQLLLAPCVGWRGGARVICYSVKRLLRQFNNNNNNNNNSDRLEVVSFPCKSIISSFLRYISFVCALFYDIGRTEERFRKLKGFRMKPL
jgi:hypothetical protein